VHRGGARAPQRSIAARVPAAVRVSQRVVRAPNPAGTPIANQVFPQNGRAALSPDRLRYASLDNEPRSAQLGLGAMHLVTAT
jgi:hypothetical protein